MRIKSIFKKNLAYQGGRYKHSSPIKLDNSTINMRKIGLRLKAAQLRKDSWGKIGQLGNLSPVAAVSGLNVGAAKW